MLNTPTFKRGLLIIGSALSFALVAGCGKPKPVAVARVVPKQPVEVAAIRQRDLTETLSLVGSLAPNESAQIRAEISGQIRAVLFEEGAAEEPVLGLAPQPGAAIITEGRNSCAVVCASPRKCADS